MPGAPRFERGGGRFEPAARRFDEADARGEGARFAQGRGRGPAPRGDEAGATRFEINWGHRGGASPQRLLAVLCRRGDVTSRLIGAIDIDTHTSTFEVAAHASHAFEAAVRQPDERDPHLFIRRARNGAPRHEAGPRRHARPAPGRY